MVGVVGKFGIADPCDLGRVHQELDHLARVVDMALNAERQRLHAL
jgi:hypothetical protein